MYIDITLRLLQPAEGGTHQLAEGKNFCSSTAAMSPHEAGSEAATAAADHCVNSAGCERGGGGAKIVQKKTAGLTRAEPCL